jgi:hypothetical protein
MLKLKYTGDASFTLQINLVAAPDPIEVSISHLRVLSLFSIHLSKAHGLTVTFRTDPVEAIQINTSFDAIGMNGIIQAEVERRIRELFREELPVLLHQESLRLMESLGVSPITLDDDADRGLSYGSSRKSSIASDGGVRVSCISPKLHNNHISDLSPILEDGIAPLKTLRELSMDPTRNDDTRSVAGSYISSRHSQSGSVISSASRFPLLMRARTGSMIPVAKRMEILRRQNSSWSPFETFASGTGSGAHILQRSTLRSPRPPHFNSPSPPYSLSSTLNDDIDGNKEQ